MARGSAGAVVTCGTFDGVHRGHQAVLAEVTRHARARPGWAAGEEMP